MVSNVACSSPGCTNPVIGQCGGYKRSCGSFYCTVHSKDKLCTECSDGKMQDDLIEEYFQLAQHVENHPKNESIKRTRPLGILFIIMLCLPLAITQVVPPDSNLVVIVLLSIPIGFIGAIVTRIYAYISENKLRKKVFSDIVATKPRFNEFYEIYKSERRKEKLRMAGSVAMGLIASAASEAQNSYERKRQEEMVRRVVDEGLNRHRM